MTSNYNTIYTSHTRRNGDAIYKEGMIFRPKSGVHYDSKIRRFIGLKIESIGYRYGLPCLEFDYNEWSNNMPSEEDMISYNIDFTKFE